MTELSQDIQAIIGKIGQEPVGPPGVVGVLPNNYLPPPDYFGPGGFGVAAAAGFRSELLFIMVTSRNDGKVGALISQLRVARSTVGASEIIQPTVALTGYTELEYHSGDMGSGRPVLRVFFKNTAAAVTGRTIVQNIYNAVAEEYQTVPGRILLRNLSDQSAVILRPTADNAGIRCVLDWQVLTRKAL